MEKWFKCIVEVMRKNEGFFSFLATPRINREAREGKRWKVGGNFSSIFPGKVREEKGGEGGDCKTCLETLFGREGGFAAATAAAVPFI